MVRVWGRRRLMLIQRFLPFVEAVDVHLLGSGLPSFWVFRAGGMTLTLGLTGFTAANWSQALELRPAPAAQDADGEAARSRARLPRTSDVVGRRRRAGQGRPGSTGRR